MPELRASDHHMPASVTLNDTFFIATTLAIRANGPRSWSVGFVMTCGCSISVDHCAVDEGLETLLISCVTGERPSGGDAEMRSTLISPGHPF
jgi:hypothetical protein